MILSSVEPFQCRTLVDGADSPVFYDGMVAVAGYERRSTRIAESLASQVDRGYAVSFPSQHMFSHAKNVEWYRQVGWTHEELDDDAYDAWLAHVLADLAQFQDEVRVAIDVSSMTRRRIGTTVEVLARADIGADLAIDFLYTPAQFVPPPDTDQQVTAVFGPVTNWFSGWSLQPELPVEAFIGLGYERDLAVGALEYIEPGTVWGFMPGGEDASYDAALAEANDWEWQEPRSGGLVAYRVDNPFECFTMLESLVYATRSRARPVIVPFGPKIFALVALVVAAAHHPDVAVWRVSAGEFLKPVDRDSNGKLVGLRLRLTAA